MHAILPIILMSNQAEDEKKRLKALEEKAVAEATATADAAFQPSPSLLNASNANALLAQVDGPSLLNYEAKESVYVGRSVPVGAGGSLTVPIQVTTPGSVVEYAIENKKYDIGFGITAEREEGVTIVRVRLKHTVISYLFNYLFAGASPVLNVCKHRKMPVAKQALRRSLASF